MQIYMDALQTPDTVQYCCTESQNNWNRLPASIGIVPDSATLTTVTGTSHYCFICHVITIDHGADSFHHYTAIIDIYSSRRSLQESLCHRRSSTYPHTFRNMFIPGWPQALCRMKGNPRHTEVPTVSSKRLASHTESLQSRLSKIPHVFLNCGLPKSHSHTPPDPIALRNLSLSSEAQQKQKERAGPTLSECNDFESIASEGLSLVEDGEVQWLLQNKHRHHAPATRPNQDCIPVRSESWSATRDCQPRRRFKARPRALQSPHCRAPLLSKPHWQRIHSEERPSKIARRSHSTTSLTIATDASSRAEREQRPRRCNGPSQITALSEVSRSFHRHSTVLF